MDAVCSRYAELLISKRANQHLSLYLAIDFIHHVTLVVITLMTPTHLLSV